MRVKTRKQCVVSVLLCLALLGFASCKKQGESKSPDIQKQTAPSGTPTATAEATKTQDVKSDPQTVPANIEPDPNKTSASQIPLPIQYPAPRFLGTEKDVKIPNLEPRQKEPWPIMMAPAGVTNVAQAKPVTSSDSEPIIGELAYITDGNRESSEGSYVELGPGKQFVTIDLGAEHEIYAAAVWHYFEQRWRSYKNVVVQISDDPDFLANVQTIFNNDTQNVLGLGIGKNMNYIETNFGKLIDAKGIKGQYVRLCSQGNTSNDQNHYIEVEVYGKPAK